MSTHEAKVIQIKEILPHPDPETVSLGIVQVWGYQVVVNKTMWKVGDLAAYVEPDNLVPLDKPEFAFLVKPNKVKAQERIKVRKLRGVWSEGLLVPVSAESFKEDDNAWDFLGLERYVPRMRGNGPGGSRPANLDSDFAMGGAWEESPVKLPFSKYDLENWKKWQGVFEEGEEVVITEKLHGASSRYVFANDRMFCGSRSGWKAENDRCSWWQALRQNDWLEAFCREHPELVVFGEIFGQVQDLKYGAQKNQIFFRAFDAFNHEERVWVDNSELFDVSMGHTDLKVPVLYIGPYSKEKVLELTDGPSVVPGADHLREGCVIKPSSERIHHRLGRVALKNVSNLYLERA